MAASAVAQLSVGPTGLANQTFSTLPAATEWSTRTVTPSSAPAVSTVAQLDSSVQTNASAALITSALTSTVSNPPGNSATAVWSSTGSYIGTRAFGNTMTLLMATLRNNSGSGITSFDIGYDYTLGEAANGTEELPGLHVYYSLTGTTGTWQKVTSISGSNVSGRRTATISTGWGANSLLYLLWADDNGSASPDDANEIDNFTVNNIVGATTPVISVQPVSQSVQPGTPVTFSVNAAGASPLKYQWRTNSVPIANATNSSYTFTPTLADNGKVFSVTVSNSFGGTVSSNATLTVSCGAPAGISAQPAANTSLASGATLNLSITATGAAPVAIQWYRNNVPLSNATNNTYSKANVSAFDSGIYYAIASNCGGPVQSSNAIVSISSPGYPIVGLQSQVWRYDDLGDNQGTAWRNVGFNDSTWKTGRGVLAYETDNATVLSLTNTLLNLRRADNSQIETYYFRTTFVLTNDPEAVSLVTSNMIDDGAVVYVNGQEAYRINMPSGAISWTTAAPGTIAEGTFITTNISSSLLVKGTNTIAVEVHQVNLTSSDIVFGFAANLNNLPPVLLSITNQPVNATAEETKSATFTVGVNGVPAYYQWYHDGQPVSNATVNPFTIPIVSPSDAGSYYVVVTNVINSVTSSVVTLTVIPDTNAPTLVMADGADTPTSVLVSYSERIGPTATNIANYRITNTLTRAILAVSKAVVTNGTNVILTTAARNDTDNYILVVNNVKDISAAQNTIATNSSMPIYRTVVWLPITANYDFLDPYCNPVGCIDEPNQGVDWRGFGFDPGAHGWAVGNYPGPFFTGLDESVIPFPVGTQLSPSSAVISYFRTTYNANASPGGLGLSVRHLLDDGAVFYLNSNEVLRVNMPAGAIDYQTVAPSVVDAAVYSDPVPLSTASYRIGTNLFAVELHQAVANDIDKAFGMEVTARVLSYVNGPVVVTGGPQDLTVVEGQSAVFTVVQAAGSSFQWQQNSNNISGANGGTNATYTIPRVTSNMEGLHFRVLVSNQSGSVTTSNATLHVIADTNAPTLFGGTVSSPTTITVTFSEPVTSATANTIANYTVTNSLGQTQPISSAALAADGTNVLLTFGSLPFQTYTVVVRNIRDTSQVGNTIASNSAVVVGYSAQPINFSGTWKYDQSHTDFSAAGWTARTYNDAGWTGSGPGLLDGKAGGRAANVLPLPVGTVLAAPQEGPGGSYLTTTYFRTHFNSYGSGIATLTFRTVLDDSAIIYLNGVEFQRIRMPAGAVTYDTQGAGGAVGDATLEGPYSVTVSNLLTGDNVIAVEVHQIGTGSSDVTWGGEFSISVPSVLIAPPAAPTNTCTTVAWVYPKLNIQWITNNNTIRLSWAGPNPITNSCGARAVLTVQQASALTNVSPAGWWVDVGTNNPTILPMTRVGGTNRFFRFKNAQ